MRTFEIPSPGGGGAGLLLGETNTTAYRGDRGKDAYDKAQTAIQPNTSPTLTDLNITGKVVRQSSGVVIEATGFFAPSLVADNYSWHASNNVQTANKFGSFGNLNGGGFRGFRAPKFGGYAWSNDVVDSGSGHTLVLSQDADSIMAQRNGAAAQAFRVYGTETGSKYAELSHDGTHAKLRSSAGDIIAAPLSGYMQLRGSAAGASALIVLDLMDSNGVRKGYLYREPTSQKLVLMNTENASLVLGTSGGDRLVLYASGGCSFGNGVHNDPSPNTLFSLGSIKAATEICATPTTFASLRTPATAGDGAFANITDGATTLLGAIATGSGSLKQTLRCDGTDWRVFFTPV